MALPSSGTLSISDIATEFNDTAPNSMSEFYRGGGKVPDSAGNSAVPTSGEIGIGDFYNAANRAAVPLTISSPTANYDLYTQASASPSYVAGTSDITLTISPGVTVSSASTGSYSLSVPGSFTSGDTITIVNDGTVTAAGGAGGIGARGPALGGAFATAGGAGGNAVYVNFPTTITNNGTLAGGGGAGGGGGCGGGGNWGGNGGGGAGTVVGGSTYYPGIAPGPSPGTATTGGTGGGGRNVFNGRGGAGGALGSAGSSGTPATSVPTPIKPAAGGGAAGYYLVGNSFVTFPATGTRLGSVS